MAATGKARARVSSEMRIFLYIYIIYYTLLIDSYHAAGGQTVGLKQIDACCGKIERKVVGLRERA